MENGSWILDPDEDEDRPWTGRIWDDGEQKTHWRFEMIRLAGVPEIYDSSPFNGAAPIGGLLDHQRPCTIIRPLVTKIDPGMAGENYPHHRTRIEGVFQALLTGLVVEDESEETFLGIGFESEAFAAWYGGRSFSTIRGEDFQAERVETSGTEKETFVVTGLGTVEATRVAFVSEDHRSSVVRTRIFLRIVFEGPRSLTDAMDLGLGLELLFGFLAGFRPRPPTFRLWQAPEVVGERARSREAELQIGGVSWSANKFPHPIERIHMCGQGGIDLQQVLNSYVASSVDFVTRIHSVESSRYFATTLNNKFAHVMPVFEEYLKATYNQADEESYATREQAFFDWVDESPDTEVREFSKKHITVVKRKSPPLQKLIKRALVSLNAEGFRFGSDLAKRITKRRAAMFHSAPLMEEEDVRSFYVEVRAVTFILLLHTLRDIGVPVQPLTDQYHSLSDFVPFLKKGSWEDEDVG